MPLYYFILKDGYRSIPDREGEELPDEATARAHAVAVAKQLSSAVDLKRHFWRIQVCDDALNPLFDVLFASVDETIAGLPSELRKLVENACSRTAMLKETIGEVHKRLDEARATMYQADQVLGGLLSREKRNGDATR